MSNRQQQLVLFVVLGVGTIALCIRNVLTGSLSDAGMVGFLIGLCGGTTSSVLIEIVTARVGDAPAWQRSLAFVVGPFGAFLVLPFSVDSFVGYWLGGIIAFCFSQSTAAAVKQG